ncbi:hypothetical protein GGR51DRAFT_286387 [Nemania sp. FL0031]|nr:hypothetical protein GGR51DRAFT_286387 [Nemania sp. FL0031]
MSSGGQSFGSNNPFRRSPGAVSVNPAVSASTGTVTGSTGTSTNSSIGIDGSPAPPTTATTTTTSQPPFTTFRTAVPESERRRDDQGQDQPVQQKPKKIIKKVRVQSPPPSSPEDAVPVTRFPAPEQLDDDDDDDGTSDSSKSDDQADDPFNTAAVEPEPDKFASEPPLPQIPPNPFARTLQDIEGTGQTNNSNTAAASTGTSTPKGSLDVDSFKRLLLTGYSNLPNVPQAAPASTGTPSGAPILGTLPDGASTTDASSVSKQSIFDALQETPRTSHEISESEALEDRKGVFPSSPLAPVPSASARKKPPPPSSRHGKLIKIELGSESNSHGMKSPALSGGPELSSTSSTTPRKSSSDSAAPYSPPGATNVNKPLPAPPLRASADDVESPFDREAAGKVPEAFAELQAHPRPPTPPATARSRSGSQTSTQSRKPAAPPPRRHGRSDSKIPAMYTTNAEEDPPRSSIESNRSRAESLRISVNSEKISHAPAPPPPRRPGHIRQGSSFTSINYGGLPSAISPGLSEKERSPSGGSFTPMTSPGLPPGRSLSITSVSTGLNGQAKMSPPPPPPTRKQSVRRPSSVRSVDMSNGPPPVRRVSREKDGAALPPPPPPPPRPRTWGSNRPNADSSTPGGEGLRKGSVGSISVGNGSATPTIEESGKQGDEILADLDALQREVDELMKKAAS